MIFLVISSGAGSFAASLTADGRVVSYRIKNEAVSIFPKDVIDDVLSEAEINADDIDYVVFLGKPFSYFERLISLHILFFPGCFLNFVYDIRDFFIEKIRIKALVKERLGYAKDICFVNTMDAVADEISRGFPAGNGLVIISLGDSMDLRTLGCYKKESRGVVLIKGSVYPNSISMLYRLPSQDKGAKPIKAKDLLKLHGDGSFILRKKFFKYNHGSIALKKGYVAEKKESEFYFTEILDKLINSTGLSFGEKVLFVSDYPVDSGTCEILRSRFKELEFISLNKTEIMEYAAKYTARQLKS
jgi:hypothetical protein